MWTYKGSRLSQRIIELGKYPETHKWICKVTFTYSIMFDSINFRTRLLLNSSTNYMTLGKLPQSASVFSSLTEIIIKVWRVLKPKLRNLSLICWEIRSPVIFEQTYYMMNLIEEHYFSGYMLIEWEGLEAKTPARRLAGQSKCERCNCRSWNRRARPKITVEEKKNHPDFIMK